MPEHLIEGHAIVSRDGMIADAAGDKPSGLRIDADWAYFQAQLDQSELTVIGRASHEADPNTSRRRLVITGAADGLEQVGPSTWRLNPEQVAPQSAIEELAPDGGRIAVVGGRRVFDLFLELGFDAFHLTVAGKCELPGGVPVFTGISSAAGARDRLARHGLVLAEGRTLDEDEDAVLWRFERFAGPAAA